MTHDLEYYIKGILMSYGGSPGSMDETAKALVELLDAELLASKPPTKVSGYTAQSPEKVALVNEFKADEERILRKIDVLQYPAGSANSDVNAILEPYDKRWLAIARTHIQEAYMALNRSVFQPQRIKLPEDDV